MSGNEENTFIIDDDVNQTTDAIDQTTIQLHPPSAADARFVRKIGSGRVRGHMWAYFEERNIDGVKKLFCKAEENCNYSLSMNQSTAMRMHLSKHRNVWQKLLERESAAKAAAAALDANKCKKSKLALKDGQQSIMDHFPKGKIVMSPKQQTDRMLCIWIAASPNIPYSIVEEKLFIDYSHRLNPSYKVPCTRMIELGVAEIAGLIRSRVADLLTAAARVTICLDLWTAADGTHCLGIVAHFYCQSTKKPMRLVVGCRKLFESASATYVSQLFNEVWTNDFGRDLGSHRIAAFVTDSGANLVKCCRHDLPMLFAISNVNESISNAFRGNMTEEIGDANLDATLDDDDEIDSFERYCIEYERQEAEYIAEFGEKRLACYQHQVQLLLRKFNDVPEIAEFLRDACKLVKKIKGRKAGEDLKEVVGMSVRSHCATRFSMKFLLLHRLLQLKNVLPQILLSNAINNLRIDQWILLEECCRLLKPFAEFTDMLGMESDATISLVIPSIQALSAHLQKFCSSIEHSPAATAAAMMDIALHARFAGCFDFDYSMPAIVYATATYLDPRYRTILSSAQHNAAKDYLQSLWPNVITYEYAIDSNIDVSTANVIDVDIDDAISDCSASSLLSAICTDRRLNQPSTSPTALVAHPIIAEFNQYESYPLPLSKDKSPIDYWNEIKSSGRATVLTSIALDILSIPASSASVERLFSAAGRAKNAVRSRLGENALENECIIRLNRHILDQ